jgi:hypothetical protein
MSCEVSGRLQGRKIRKGQETMDMVVSNRTCQSAYFSEREKRINGMERKL